MAHKGWRLGQEDGIVTSELKRRLHAKERDRHLKNARWIWARSAERAERQENFHIHISIR